MRRTARSRCCRPISTTVSSDRSRASGSAWWGAPGWREKRRRTHMARPPKQTGGSRRGTAQLDIANDNRGVPPDEATKGDDEDQALASGETTGETKRRQARDRTEEPTVRERPPTSHPDEETEAAKSAQPGGDRPSESERPTGRMSRWGRGPDDDD